MKLGGQVEAHLAMWENILNVLSSLCFVRWLVWKPAVGNSLWRLQPKILTIWTAVSVQSGAAPRLKFISTQKIQPTLATVCEDRWLISSPGPTHSRWTHTVSYRSKGRWVKLSANNVPIPCCIKTPLTNKHIIYRAWRILQSRLSFLWAVSSVVRAVDF